ncbi:MAG: FAD-dependent oxidoreductase, partial [Planctomycetia bacterium]
MSTFDVIVLGAGGVGAAACDHLARRGVRVLGIDRHRPPHGFGSTHGQTRMIRQAYFEHPDYVPLLQRAYTLWDDLSSRVDRKLFHRRGVLEVGAADGEVISGVRERARRHGLALENLSTDEVQRRFPGFRVPDGMTAVFESNAGYLMVEDAVG